MIDSKTCNAFRYFQKRYRNLCAALCYVRNSHCAATTFQLYGGDYLHILRSLMLEPGYIPALFTTFSGRTEPPTASESPQNVQSISVIPTSQKNVGYEILCALSAPTARIIALPGIQGAKGAHFFYLSIFIILHSSLFFPKERMNDYISIIILSFIITSIIICVGFSYVGFSNIGKSNIGESHLGSCVFCL